MVTGPVAGTAAILEALLDAGHDVTALTNYSAETFPKAEATFPILGRFRGITVSGRGRLMKPDLAIYRHHAELRPRPAAATLFFDDNAKNVEGARAAGWNAELFTGRRRRCATISAATEWRSTDVIPPERCAMRACHAVPPVGSPPPPPPSRSAPRAGGRRSARARRGLSKCQKVQPLQAVEPLHQRADAVDRADMRARRGASRRRAPRPRGGRGRR